MRLCFRASVQLLDGVEHTQPNADGILPELLSESGFREVYESDKISTLTGSISILHGLK